MTRTTKETANRPATRPGSRGLSVQDWGTDHVAILLALYDGAAALPDQLESIARQSHRDWSLIVSDDGSCDGGPDIVMDFARGHTPGRVSVVRGPGAGFARNFLSLVRAAGPSVPYAALSDQDDAWLPQKLTRALSHLKALPATRPALYSGRTIICDDRLRPLRRSPAFRLPPGFANALVQSIGGGNTMVLNRAALDLVQETSGRVGDIVAHDWWIYQIVSGAGGIVLHDPEPMVLYRQHAGNLIGANDTLSASVARVGKLLGGRFRDWNDVNIAALEASRHWLTPEARQTLDLFQAARARGPRERLVALRKSGVYRQTRRGNAALWLAALLGRL
jgi:glycosyltransferase involved in cell wall biosynthesis